MFSDGVETIALRPGFTGKVEEFGMLIPFPAVPALRKIDDDTFAHIESSIDPPQVKVWVYEPRRYYLEHDMPSMAAESDGAALEAPLAVRKNEVRVLKEEAVGMYEVAVLAAGSARALQRWMDEHAYRYPEGMDDVAEDYVKIGWVFVAIKTRVAAAAGVAPRPGMRKAEAVLPAGASFDGHVQGMGFRFRVAEPVVPMRLSVFNGEDPRNVVYMLTDEAVRIDDVPESLVVRQLPGSELFANLTEPLDLIFMEGNKAGLGPNGRAQVDEARRPEPFNRIAAELFAADLLAISSGELSLPFEEEEKELLRVSEALNLRGPDVDRLHTAAIEEQRTAALDGALKDLRSLTMTVFDGVFPGRVLADQNLEFSPYRIPAARNLRRNDALRPPDQEIWVERGW
jgi:hypothetical protein